MADKKRMQIKQKNYPVPTRLVYDNNTVQL